jgi:hypothetical protein
MCDDTKWVARNHSSMKYRQYNGQKKDRQYNGQKKDRQPSGQKKDRQPSGQKIKDKKTNNDLQNTTQKTKD